MRIDTITLQNFRSYADGEFRLDAPITFVGGRNGAGKSTIVDALRWALAGHCRGTDARGTGAETLMRLADQPVPMAVTVRMTDAGGPFQITRAHNGASARTEVSWPLGGKETPAAAILNRLGVSAAVVDACLHTDHFLDLHHAEAKNLLLAVLDVRVPIGEERLTLDQVESRYKDAFERRRQGKADLSAIVVPQRPDQAPPDVAALEEKLAGLRDDEKALITTSAVATGRRAELERQLAAAQQAADDAGRRVASFPDLAQAIENARAELAAATPDGDAEAAVQQHRVSLVDADGRLKVLADHLHAVETHDPERGCVLHADIPCKTSAKQFRGRMEALRSDIEQLTALVASTRSAIAAAEADVMARAGIQARIAGLEADLAAQRRAEEAHESALERVAALQTEISNTPEDSAEDPALVELRARIAKGEEVIRTGRDLAAKMAAHLNAIERQREASRALGAVEREVDLLGPKGARAQALTDAMGAFEGRINAALARFGYELHICVEPWLVMVNQRPSDLLSASERLRVGVALQLALAEISGFGFVAIDQVDMLDRGHRMTLAEVLQHASQSVQVLAACTFDDDRALPAPPGWTVYRLRKDAGAATQVERVNDPVPA